MHTIITSDHESGITRVLIHAPECKLFIVDTDCIEWHIEISGKADKPFIRAVRFIGCTIIADDLSSFEECYFQDDCTMLVKNMPKSIRSINTAESINRNRISVDA